MAYYPDISNNTAEAKFDLNETYTDNSFDIYVFDNNSINTAFMVFVIKNTSEMPATPLIINSFSGTTQFNENFQLDFIEEGETLLHMGPDGAANNKLKPVTAGGLSQTGTGVSAADLATVASGASAVFGYGLNSSGSSTNNVTDSSGGTITANNNDAQELNQAGSPNIMPVYTTTDIVNNPISEQTYASFIVRYKPTVAQAAAGPLSDAVLTISNSANTQYIHFSGTAANLVTITGEWGTATGGIAIDSWSPGGIITPDGGVRDFGYWPVGYKWEDTNATLRLSDTSVQVGTFSWGDATTVANTFVLNSHTNNNLPNQDLIDVAELTTAGTGLTSRRDDLLDSINHTVNVFRSEFDCAGENDNTIFVPSYMGTTNTTVFKNFSLRSSPSGAGLHVSQRSTHMASNMNQSYDDLKHVDENDIKLLIYFEVGPILNTQFAQQNEGDSFYVFGVKTGWYNKLSMSTDQIVFHEDLDSVKFDKRVTNIGLNSKRRARKIGIVGTGGDDAYGLDDGVDNRGCGPWLGGKSDVGYLEHETLYRDGVVTLALHVRFNNFSNGSGETYGIPSFDLSTVDGANSFALYSSYGGDQEQASGNYTANRYNQAEFNTTDVEPIYGPSVTNNATAYTENRWDTGGDAGSFLGVRYNIHQNGFLPEHMYNYQDYINLAHIGYLEGHFGHIEHVVRPGSTGNAQSVWKRGFHGSNFGSGDGAGIRYRIAFLPKISKVQLVPSDSVLDTIGAAVSPQLNQCLLFNDSTNEESAAKKYSMATNYGGGSTNVMQNWYYVGTSTSADSDVSTKSYAGHAASEDSTTYPDTVEGDWYGSCGMVVNKPRCWNTTSGSNVRRYDEYQHEDDGHLIGRYIRHAPTNIWNRIGEEVFEEMYQRGVHNWIDLEPASYDSNVQKWRSVGRIYIKNTGDYPIWIQNISIGHNNLNIDGNVTDGTYNKPYMPTASLMLIPENSTSQPGGVNPHANSNTPTWSVNRTSTNGWSDDTAGRGLGAGSSYKRIPDNLAANTTATGYEHYHVNNAPNNDLYISKQMFIPSNWNSDTVIQDSCSIASKHTAPMPDSSKTFDDYTYGNWFNVAFELDPTNTTAYDQGFYYAQVLVSYYVDNYTNRYIPNVNGLTGQSQHQEIYIGETNGESINYQTVLHVTKYLVRVHVQGSGEIAVVDVENDAAPGTINLPTLSVG